MDNHRNSPLECALIEVIKKRLIDFRVSQREAERMLGLGHGTLGNILRGRTALRIYHLELLGPILGFTLEQILREAADPAGARPDSVFVQRVASLVIDELLQRTTAVSGDFDPASSTP